MSIIRIHRAGGFADRWRAYKILIDGDEAGRIRKNSTLEIPVSPGPHSIVAKIDWTSSEEIQVCLAEGNTLDIDVANTYGAAKATFAMTAGMNSYLTLTVRDAT